MKTLLVILMLAALAACASPAPETPTSVPPTPSTPPTHTSAPPTLTVTNPPSSGDAPFLPNPATQPGWNNPAVNQDTIQQTICVPGYSSSIRPPLAYTDALKAKQIPDYGYTDTSPAHYEEDHLIALEAGGDPRDVRNLWPQPRSSQPWNAGVKDTLENTLHMLICNGSLPLDTARHAIATDWVAAYRKYVSPTILPVTAVPTEP